MALLSEGNVAAHNSSKVVQIIGKYIFGQDISMESLPSATSALTFADEAHHVAKQQIVERIRKSDHFTYALDGTSRQKRNFIERHIIMHNKKVMSIGFVEIATDDANTLLEQSIAMFKELAEIYCSGASNQQPDDILKELIRKLKCIMSDRAAVMKSFDEKMASFKKDFLGDDDASTHFLFCNAHFLLGLASAAKQGLNISEEKLIEEGGALGRDASAIFKSYAGCKESGASRLVRTAAEVFGPRGDERNGCRQYWLAYCHKIEVKSRFTSFRDNRFNNSFENAEAVIFHLKHVSDFLQTFIPHSNLKLKSILLDLKDKRVVSEVLALAVCQVLLTGPYWALMNSTLPYGSFPRFVQSMDQAVLRWCEEDFTFDLHPVFEDFSVNKEIVKECLQSGECSLELVQSIFKDIMKQFSVVLKRQFKDFLPGGIYGGDISHEVQEVLNTCPLTNLTGERLFGDLDHDMTRRRNASTYHRSSLNMRKHNATAEWIAEKEGTDRDAILEAGRKNGKDLRKRYKAAAVDAVREKQKVKLEETDQKKKKQEIEQAEKEADLLNKIIAVGGLVTTKEELDALYRKGKAVDLKAQIQYRKIFMKKKDLKVSGNMKTLYQRLLGKINAMSAPDDEEPLRIPVVQAASGSRSLRSESTNNSESESDSELTSNISSLSDFDDFDQDEDY